MACRFGLAVSAFDGPEKYKPISGQFFWIALLLDQLLLKKS
jgi:hypothetical protein